MRLCSSCPGPGRWPAAGPLCLSTDSIGVGAGAREVSGLLEPRLDLGDAEFRAAEDYGVRHALGERGLDRSHRAGEVGGETALIEPRLAGERDRVHGLSRLPQERQLRPVWGIPFEPRICRGNVALECGFKS